jgi:hypothetical protein
MQTKCVSNTDFQGKLIIVNGLSNKPYLNIRKVKRNLEKQIEPKDYNLYVEQDYKTDKINIGVSFLQPRYISGVVAHEEIPITAKSNRYIYAVKSAIDKHEQMQREKEEQEWKQEQKQKKIEHIKDVIGSILLSPVFIAGAVIHEICPKLGKKFENLLQKIGI